MSLLQTNELTIGYKKTVVQQDLNLQVAAGELVCLIGTNGCGKSTLLRTLAGLQKPHSGTIRIHDKTLQELSATEKALALSFVLTEKVEVDNLTVFDLVFTGRYPHTSWLGNRMRKDFEKTNEAIEMVHLTHKTQCFINELSDGEKQRAMIAKALAQDTPLILLDEPTAHLDLPNRVEIMLLLRRLAKENNKAIIISTHEIDLALQISNQIWLMDESGIETGAPSDVRLINHIQRSFVSDLARIDISTGRLEIKL